MKDYRHEALSHDPVHGYIPFISDVGLPAGEVSEREIIDHPWVQRLRQIHQLQTAWWVFPTAEHSRFQHVVGVMHLASRAIGCLGKSLLEVCPEGPSLGYLETLARLTGLLHDVGHGPFGHFLDEHFLSDHGLTHETLGAKIVQSELGDLLRRVRRNPNGQLLSGEEIDPAHIAYLMTRPKEKDDAPRWLRLMRSLFCGLYTVDNMDFVLRDAYMTGYSPRAFDLERLLHYSFFTEQGLTIHSRGLSSLVSFLGVRAEMFRNIYFHRTVRGVDLTLQDLFVRSKQFLFSGNPGDNLERYRKFTEWSLLVDVARWSAEEDSGKRALGLEWESFLARNLTWKPAAERTIFYSASDPQRASIFSRDDFFEEALREQLPQELKKIPLRVDRPQHVHRPGTKGATAGQNFVQDQAGGKILPVSDSELFRNIPASYRICRVYTRSPEHNQAVAQALNALVGGGGSDDLTNM